MTGIIKLLPDTIFPFPARGICIEGNNISDSLGMLLLFGLRDAILLE